MPELNIYDKDWPVWTVQEQLPPAKFVHDRKGKHGVITNTLAASGCIVLGSKISKLLMFSKVRISFNCVIDQCVIMPDAIGENCHLKKVIVDRGCVFLMAWLSVRILKRMLKIFLGLTKGVVLVTKQMIDNLKK